MISLTKKNFFLYIALLFILLLGIYLRLKYYNDGIWSDEWIGYFFSNSQVPLEINYNNWFKFEGAPSFNYFFYSIYNYLFGHFYQSIEIGSLFFGILLTFLAFYFFSDDNQKNFFLFFLFIANPFLIYYSGEIRFYSASAFFSFISLVFFLKILKKNNLLDLIFFIVFTLISVSINPFAISNIISFLFFLIFKKKYKFIKYLFFITLLFIFINYNYLINISANYKAWGGTSSFNVNFFIGWYFNIFFGNKFLGGLILIFLLFNIIIIKKKLLNKKFEKLLLFYLIIFFGYLIPIIYGLLKNPVFFPRHFIYLVPVILLILAELIYSLKNRFTKISFSFVLIIFLIFINFTNSKPFIINKPNPSKIINHLKESDVKTIYFKNFVFENDNKNLIDISKNIYFENKIYNFNSKLMDFYAHTAYLHSKEFRISDYNFLNSQQVIDQKSFWSVCMDGSGINKLKSEQDKCKKIEFLSTHYIKREFIENYFYLRLYEKKV